MRLDVRTTEGAKMEKATVGMRDTAERNMLEIVGKVSYSRLLHLFFFSKF